MQQRPIIVGIAGSLREGSYSCRALGLAIQRVRSFGATTKILNLQTMTLPFATGDKEEAFPDYPDVERLRTTVKQADGLILATPEYHGSLSGALKNALDLMDFEHIEGKVCGAISVLGGPNNSNALNHLRMIMRQCHAWMIPEQIAIGHARNAFGQDGNLLDKELAERLNDFARSLVENTCRLRDIATIEANKNRATV